MDQSCTDYAWGKRSVSATGLFSWDGAPGDRCWNLVNFCVAHTPKPRRPSPVWRCTDKIGFQQAVIDDMPAEFTSVDHFHDFVASKMSAFESNISAKARIRTWEPFAIKELRRRIRICLDPARADTMRMRLFNVRVAWAKRRDDARTENELRHRRLKSKKLGNLFPYNSLEVDGIPTVEQELWPCEVVNEFERRWKQSETWDRDLMECQGALSDHAVTVTAYEVRACLNEMTRKARRDIHSVSVEAISLVHKLCVPLAVLCSHVLSSDSWASQLKTHGRVRCKVAGSSKVSDSRGILPMERLAELCHRLWISKCSSILQAFSKRNQTDCLMLGSGRGSGTAEVSFAQMLVLEKGRDRHNAGGIAQADIKQHHDSVPWGATVRGLVSAGVELSWASAGIRLHRCPKVYLKVGRFWTLVIRRSRGVHIGASSAALLARGCR